MRDHCLVAIVGSCVIIHVHRMSSHLLEAIVYYIRLVSRVTHVLDHIYCCAVHESVHKDFGVLSPQKTYKWVDTSWCSADMRKDTVDFVENNQFNFFDVSYTRHGFNLTDETPHILVEHDWFLLRAVLVRCKSKSRACCVGQRFSESYV